MHEADWRREIQAGKLDAAEIELRLAAGDLARAVERQRRLVRDSVLGIQRIHVLRVHDAVQQRPSLREPGLAARIAVGRHALGDVLDRLRGADDVAVRSPGSFQLLFA